LTDEDFDNDILEAVRRRMPEIDVVRVQDVGLGSAGDARILEWAAEQDRILLTHDRSTMQRHVDARLAAGLRVGGVCVVKQIGPLGRRIEDLLLLIQSLVERDWEYPIWHVPI
jgi:hypothetical protein